MANLLLTPELQLELLRYSASAPRLLEFMEFGQAGFLPERVLSNYMVECRASMLGITTLIWGISRIAVPRTPPPT